MKFKSMPRKILTTLVFFLFVIGFTIRIVNLSYPQVVSFEEASRGYISYSISLIGRDDNGQKYPILFKSLTNYPPPLPIYFSTIFIKFFGLNSFGLRFLGAILGSLSIIIFFIISYFLIQNTSSLPQKEKSLFPFLAAFLLTFSPWHIFISRHDLNLTETLFFSLVLSLLIIFFLLTQKKFLIWLASLTILANIFSSYYSLFPLFFLLFFLKLVGLIKIRHLAILIIPFFIIISLIIFNKEYRKFLINNSVYHETLLFWEIEPRRQQDTEKGLRFLARPLHNKATYLLEYLGKKYVNYFDPEFLASPQLTGFKEHTKRIPKIFFWEIPLFLIGVYYFFIFSKEFSSKKIFLFLLLFLAILPFENLFWKENFLKKEMIFFLPIFYFFLALGLIKVVLKLKSKKLALFFFVLGGMFFYSFGYLTIIKIYTNPKSWTEARDEIYFQLFKRLDQIKESYQKIVITDIFGQPQTFALFYLKYPPQKYLDTKEAAGFDKNYLTRIDSFGKFQFSSIKNIKNKLPEVLYIGLREEFVNPNNPTEVASFQPFIKESFTFNQENPKQDDTVWFVILPKKELNEISNEKN